MTPPDIDPRLVEYIETLKLLKIHEGRLDAMLAVQRELFNLRSRGERPTWDLWEGVISQMTAEMHDNAMAAAHQALEQVSGATIH